MVAQSNKVSDIVEDMRAKVGEGIPLAIALHNFVRDEIAFGFTPYFDAASPEKTLELRTGHCNPQARLMVDLFRKAGFEARFQPVTITDEVLNGAVKAVPKLSHVFTEVRLDRDWIRLDSYIADARLRAAAVAKLESQNRVLGYGCHVTATGEWDGQSDAFSQVATPDLIMETHQPVFDIEDFYRSDKYLHRFGPVPFNAMFALGRPFTSFFLKLMNARLNRLREAPQVSKVQVAT